MVALGKGDPSQHGTMYVMSAPVSTHTPDEENKFNSEFDSDNLNNSLTLLNAINKIHPSDWAGF
jgi:hypothetical protein